MAVQTARLPPPPILFHVVGRDQQRPAGHAAADSVRMIGRFPVSGVGAGNFLFYLKYLRFEQKSLPGPALEPVSPGLQRNRPGRRPGVPFFPGALLRRQKPGHVRFIIWRSWPSPCCSIIFSGSPRCCCCSGSLWRACGMVDHVAGFQKACRLGPRPCFLFCRHEHHRFPGPAPQDLGAGNLDAV